jgi:hypothetical protein
MREPKVAVGLILSIGLLTLLSQYARAELLVSGVTGVQGVAIGDRFSDNHVFKLSANSELRLIKSPDNSLFIMHGPYEGTLSKFIESCRGLLATTQRHCRNDTAGDELPVGGTRGAR